MAQSTPSVMFYSQALKLVQDLRQTYINNANTSEDVVAKLRDVLTSLEDSLGSPLYKYESFAETEPPLSGKVNRIWDTIQYDINILQNQTDVLRAAAVFSHNILTTNILNASQENARLQNKAKTLQLYSNSRDPNIIVFG